MYIGAGIQQIACFLQIAQPAKLLLGVGENRGYIHLMFAFFNPRAEDNYNDNVALSYMLPVRDED